MLAKVPTAPEMAQVATSSRAAASRSRHLENSAIGLGELDAEGRRLGVDAVRTADGDGVLVLEGPPLQGRQKRVDVGKEKVGGAHELHVEAGVEDVGGGHALMDEAGIRPDDLGEMGEEGDDVVLRRPLDLVDAVDVEFGLAALLPDRSRRRSRNDAELGERVAGVRLDLEPDAELRFGRPDGRHFRAGVTRDHAACSVVACRGRGSL